MEKMRYPLSMALAVQYVEKGIWTLDSEGIPYVKYGAPIGDQYNPTTVCQYALGLWEMMPSESDSRESPYWRAFSTQVSWLRRRFKEERGFPVWTYDFDLAAYSLRSGWISALSQGQAISVLLRSSSLDDVEDLDLAERAYLAFEKSVDDGGVLTRTPEGFMWLEECPSVVPSLILNGFIFALFGIWELYLVTKKAHYRETWDHGIRSLEGTTRFYDAGYWCYYDRYSKRSYRALISDHYMEHVYIPQFEALHALTGNLFFREYAQRWKKYAESLTSNLMRRMLSALRTARVPHAEKKVELVSTILQPRRGHSASAKRARNTNNSRSSLECA